MYPAFSTESTFAFQAPRPNICLRYQKNVAHDYDFALMKLDKPVPINHCIGVACLPTNLDTPGAECSITGAQICSKGGLNQVFRSEDSEVILEDIIIKIILRASIPTLKGSFLFLTALYDQLFPAKHRSREADRSERGRGWGTLNSSGPTPDLLQEAPVKLLSNKVGERPWMKMRFFCFVFLIVLFFCWVLEDFWQM